VEQRKLSVARYFKGSAYQIKMVCTLANAINEKDFNNAGVEVIQIGRFKNIFQWSKYKQVLKIVFAGPKIISLFHLVSPRVS